MFKPLRALAQDLDQGSDPALIIREAPGLGQAGEGEIQRVL